MKETIHTIYKLSCRMCGQVGSLHITTHSWNHWSFVTVGFIGLAVNRYNPPNSILRCNACSSPVVQVDPADVKE